MESVYKAEATISAPGLSLEQGAPPSPESGPPAPSSPVVLSLQQLKLIFDAIAGVRSSEFELLGEVRRALWGGGGGPGQDPTGQTSTSSPPQRPQGGGRRSCSAPPHPCPTSRARVYSSWRGPRPRFLPPPLPASRGGWVRPLVLRHPQAVGVRLKARPWWGAGCALYRASKAPGGVHSERPVASGGRRTCPRETPPS